MGGSQSVTIILCVKNRVKYLIDATLDDTPEGGGALDGVRGWGRCGEAGVGWEEEGGLVLGAPRTLSWPYYLHEKLGNARNLICTGMRLAPSVTDACPAGPAPCCPGSGDLHGAAP